MKTKIQLEEVDDYVRVEEFRQQFPQHFPNENSLRWALRHRQTNGWVENGVVVEIRNNPSASKGTLLMSGNRYRQLMQKRIQGE